MITSWYSLFVSVVNVKDQETDSEDDADDRKREHADEELTRHLFGDDLVTVRIFGGFPAIRSWKKMTLYKFNRKAQSSCGGLFTENGKHILCTDHATPGQGEVSPNNNVDWVSRRQF